MLFKTGSSKGNFLMIFPTTVSQNCLTTLKRKQRIIVSFVRTFYLNSQTETSMSSFFKLPNTSFFSFSIGRSRCSCKSSLFFNPLANKSSSSLQRMSKNETLLDQSRKQQQMLSGFFPGTTFKSWILLPSNCQFVKYKPEKIIRINSLDCHKM